MEVAIYQLEGQPMAIVSFAQGVDALQAAKQAVPVGVPFWLVPKQVVDDLYAEHGEWRDAWQINSDAIGREPDGVGEQ